VTAYGSSPVVPKAACSRCSICRTTFSANMQQKAWSLVLLAFFTKVNILPARGRGSPFGNSCEPIPTELVPFLSSEYGHAGADCRVDRLAKATEFIG
jgi:hypothetical protein